MSNTTEQKRQKSKVGDMRNCPKCTTEVIVTEGMVKSRCYYCTSCWSKIQAEYVAKNRDKKRAWNNAYLKRDNGAAKRGAKNYKERHPDKKKAHNSVQTALRNGTLIKSPCEICGESKVEGHHDDYSKPLQVIWLCHKHHTEHHQAMLKAREQQNK